jgi:hypothetical protein
VGQVAVPFRHILRRAALWASDQTNSDSDTLTLIHVEDNDTADVIDASKTWGDSTDKAKKTAFGGEGTEREPGLYMVEVISDAGDEMKNPTLALMVSPVPPGPA